MTLNNWIDKHSTSLMYGVLMTALIVFFALFLFKAFEQTSVEENRVFTMVVDVYYSDKPERHTYVSDGREIIYSSYRGTNSVHADRLFVSTSAPIKVVSYTYKKKQ